MQEMGKCKLCNREGAQWILKRTGGGNSEKFLVHYPCGRNIIRGAPPEERPFLKLAPSQEMIKKSQVKKFWRQRIGDAPEDVDPQENVT